MKFPQRPANHITESASYRVFSNTIPDEWIVRNVTERDYGIDCYIEISENGFMTGKLLSVQIKGSADIIPRNGNTVYYGVSSSEFNYWYSLPVPVLFVYVDLSTDEVFYCNIKQYVRSHYDFFTEQQLKNITIPNSDKLRKDTSEQLIMHLYTQETGRLEYEILLSKLFSSLRDNCELMTNHFCRDCFLGLDFYGEESDDLIQFLQLYKELLYFANKFGIPWNVKSVLRMIKDGQKVFGDFYQFYEAEIALAVKSIAPVYKQIVEYASNSIMENKEYWIRKDIFVFSFVEQRLYEESIHVFESIISEFS